MERVGRERLHMTLLDPDKLPADQMAALASAAQEAGTDAIMIGGSTGVSVENLNETINAIKADVSLPIIIFPTNASTLSPHADAIFFMSMLNSSELQYVIHEQMRAAKVVKKLGIEVIPMGYIIVEPGMKVGEVARAVPIPREDVKLAASYALAGEYLGMRLIYLEAGSGADKHVAAGMATHVKETIGVPLIVGGGIRTPEAARELAQAGADIIVTGTVVEDSTDPRTVIGGIVDAIKSVPQV